MSKREIKQSRTKEIRRSQINLNPFNPKRHTDKKVEEQRKNFLRFGFLGGVTWNEATGNLIDGHRRIMALDLYHGYDGTPKTDYLVKVEAVSFDEKQEKEQMTYMALGNTKADYQLIADYINDIDPAMAGIDTYDMQQIEYYLPSADEVPVESFDDLIQQRTEPKSVEASEQSLSERKESVKEAKAAAKIKAVESFKDLNAYITISFSSHEQKLVFCDMMGIGEDDKFIEGEKVLQSIN